MSYKLNGLRIFMGVILCYGIFLLLLSLKTSIAANHDCSGTKVQNSIKALIIISTMMVSISFTFLLCGCGESYQGSTFTHATLLCFVWALTISNITMGQIIVANCSSSAAKHDAKIYQGYRYNDVYSNNSVGNTLYSAMCIL